MTRPSRFLLAAALLLPLPAMSATLGLDTRPAPAVTGAGGAAMIPGLGFLLEAEGATATAPAAATGLSVIVPFADPIALLGALFVLDAQAEDFLSGDLTAVGFETTPGEDRLEFLFENLSGAASPFYGWGALLEVWGEFGDDPFGMGFGSLDTPEDVTFALRPAVSPVPLTLPFGYLAAGLGIFSGLGALRRRNHTGL